MYSNLTTAVFFKFYLLMLLKEVIGVKRNDSLLLKFAF